MKRQNSVTSADFARTALAALSIDIQQRGGNDQKRHTDDGIRNGVEQDEAGRPASDGGRDPSAPNDSQDVIVSINQRVAALASNGRRQVNRPPVSFLTAASAHSSHARNLPKAKLGSAISLHMRADRLAPAQRRLELLREVRVISQFEGMRIITPPLPCCARTRRP